MNKIEMLKALENDDDFKKEVAEVLCRDEGFVREMGLRIMGVSLLELGVNSPGTLGEFMLNDVKRRSKNK